MNVENGGESERTQKFKLLLCSEDQCVETALCMSNCSTEASLRAEGAGVWSLSDLGPVSISADI